MDDLISRQAAIDWASKIPIHDLSDGRGFCRVIFADDFLKALKTIPLAQSHWIPCSERLPEDDTLMLVNYIDNRPNAGDIWIGWHEMENVWYIDGEEHSKERGNEVVAWMPLPEPYKGEES